jgi:hypothetical protein
MRQVVVYLCILLALSLFVDETAAGRGRRRRKSAELSNKLDAMKNLPAKVNALYASKVKHDAPIKTNGILFKHHAPTSFDAKLMNGHTGVLTKHSVPTIAPKASPLATILPKSGLSTMNTATVKPRSSLMNTASIPTTPILPRSTSMNTASIPTTPSLPRSASMNTATVPHPNGVNHVASVSTVFTTK